MHIWKYGISKYIAKFDFKYIILCRYCLFELVRLHNWFFPASRVIWRYKFWSWHVFTVPYRAHNVIVHNLSYDIDLQLDTRMLKFVHLGLNHSNNVCKSILLSKLCCLQSTFASIYRYLSSKYNFSHNDWFTEWCHLIGKV